jgi:hypothetical protein
VRFDALLARNVRGFWATSYSFGLKLFDQYLLRKLSQGSLNAVVLADHDKLADVWEHLPESEYYMARQVGRRYLLRGVRLPGGGAFHAKTYLFVQADRATLLLGSGNLTRDGIDGGRETFTALSSQVDADLPSMRAWASWAARIVDDLDDPLLTARWAALRDTCPWMLGATDGSYFLHNRDQSLITQLATHLPAEVSELHLSSPFFDPGARALKRLIATARPELVQLYLGAGPKVNGPSLIHALEGAPTTALKRFEPRTFVHAKLIGAIGPEGDGVLLVGSPNLSQAALTTTYGDGGAGNCETALVRHGTADQIRAVFGNSGLSLVDEPLDTLGALEFEEDHPSNPRPL